MLDIAIYGNFRIWKTMYEDGRKSVWKGAYGLKRVQRFELFCQIFSLCPPVEPLGSYSMNFSNFCLPLRGKN